MTLSGLLKPELILLKTACVSKDELIIRLVEAAYSAEQELPLSKDDLLQNIYTREKIGGTMLPSGLSLPHARLKNFDGFVITLGTSQNQIIHEEIKLGLMALMISSQTGGSYYLPAIAAMTKISRDNEYFSRLCAADNAEDFICILRGRDPEVA